MIITTSRLTIRPLQHDDTDALCVLFGDAEVMRYGDGVQSREYVVQWIDRALTHYQQRGYGPYAVMLTATDTLIGYCGLFHFDDINGRPEVEIGYRLVRSAWGHGYATEAARAVREAATSTLGITRLIAMIDPGNTASVRVAHKLGMHYAAEVMFEGYTHPDHVYVWQG